MIQIELSHLFHWKILSKDSDPQLIDIYKEVLVQWELKSNDFLSIRDFSNSINLKVEQDITFHTLILALIKSNIDGHTCLYLNDLVHIYSFIPENDRSIIIESIEKNLTKQTWNSLIGDSEQTKYPIIYHQKKLYFQKTFLHERRLEALFRARFQHHSPNATFPIDKIKSTFDEILITHPLQNSNGTQMLLNEEQKIAMALPILKNTVIITGGPGTGKTSIMANLIRSYTILMLDQDPNFNCKRIALTAPTGKAAQRLSDAIHSSITQVQNLSLSEKEYYSNIKGSTIHRLLHYQVHQHRFQFTHHNPLPFDLIIIDEVSMIPLSLMKHLIEAISLQTRIILLGDIDQLPSVEAGQVLRDLLPKKMTTPFSSETKQSLKKLLDINIKTEEDLTPPTDYTVKLQKSFRSNSNILNLANTLNHRGMKQLELLLDQYPSVPLKSFKPNNQSICFLEPNEFKSPAQLNLILERWLQTKFLSQTSWLPSLQKAYSIDQLESNSEELQSIFKKLEEHKILTGTKQGLLGSEQINSNLKQLFQKQIFPNFGSTELFQGCPIMITQNDHQLQLYNGDQGIALLIQHHQTTSLQIVFKKEKSFQAFPISRLPSFQLSFAITIHKSQGSEYKTILLVLPNSPSRAIQKEILYTGLTRAKEQVWIYGSKDTFKSALHHSTKRQSGWKL